MTDSASERSTHDQQVDALIAEFELAAEQGRPLSREEFLKQHAEFATELREYLDDVSRLRVAAQPFQSEPDETEPISGSAPRTLKPGMAVRYFGDYEILEELGSGGMGVVYKARQQKLKRTVALKMIKRGQFATEEEVKRFQAEARAAAKLDHPGIVGVLEVGLHQGEHFYAMDYVAGGSLSQLYREQPVAARHAAELVKKLAEATHHAHGQGIVHRDLKPANVLLTTTGAPRITDFGLALRMRSDDDSTGVSMTQTGQVLGTAGYMSPEQAAGKTGTVNTPTDIYSLGAILYALLTSRAPFVGDSPSVTIFQVINKEPVPIRALNPSVPRDLETICLKCLEKEPHKRYGTAQLLADDLTRFLENKPVLARPVGPAERTWRWCRRNPWAATALAMIAVVTVVSPPVAWRQMQLKTELVAAQSQLRGTIKRLELQKAKLEIAYDDLKRKDEENTTLNSNLVNSNNSLGTQLNENRRLVSELTTKEQNLRGALYLADMQRLPRLLETPNPAVASDILKRHIPQPGEDDLRSFEWFYLWRRVNAAKQLGSKDLVFPAGGVGEPLLETMPPSMAISSDQKYSASHSWIGAGRLTVRELDSALNTNSVPINAGPGTALLFSPDSRWLVASSLGTERNQSSFSSGSGKVRLFIYDIAKRKLVDPPFDLPAEDGEKFLFWAGMDGQGRVVVPATITIDGRSEGRLTVWDFENRKRVRNVPSQSKWSALVSQKGTLRNFVCTASGDGKLFACANALTETIEVWNWEEEEPRVTIQGSIDPAKKFENMLKGTPSIGSLAFHPDGSLLAVGEGGGRITLWDTKTGKQVGELEKGHTSLVRSLSFAANGESLASGGDDKFVCVWSIEQRRLLTQLVGHRSSVVDVSLGAGGRLYSLGKDSTVKLWNVELSSEFQQHIGQVVAVSPDGNHFVEVRGGPRILQKNATRPKSISLEPRKLVLRNARTGKDSWSHTLPAVQVHTDDLLGINQSQAHTDLKVHFLPDGKSLIACSQDKAQILNFNEPLDPRNLGDWPGSMGSITVDISDDGELLAVGTLARGDQFNLRGAPVGKGIASKLCLYRLPAAELVVTEELERLIALEFEKGTQDLLVATLSEPPPKPAVPGKLPIRSIPDTVVSRWSMQPHFAAKKEELSRARVSSGAVPFGPIVTSLPGWLFLNEGIYLERGKTGESKLTQWNIVTGQPQATYEGHGNEVTSIAIDPAVRTLVTSSDDGTVRLWDLRTGDEKLQLNVRDRGTKVVGFTAHGRTLVTRHFANDEHSVRFWRGAGEDELSSKQVNQQLLPSGGNARHPNP